MKAAILKSPGEFIIEEVESPRCPPGGILLKVEASAICSADVKMIERGHKALVHPRIPGHEVAGTVIESESPAFNSFERVQVAPGIVCGHCRYCHRGFTNHCESIDIIGFTLDGGFAEYLAVPAKGIQSGIINKIPENLGFQEAALAEPLACCLNSQAIVRINKNDTVLVLGAGPIGCLQAMLARLNGAKKVLLADILTHRLEQAGKAGPDRLIDSSKEVLEEAVKHETRGYGADVIILACASAEVSYSLLQMLAPRGRICFFCGLSGENANLSLNGNLIHYREATLAGAYGCTSGQNDAALKLIASGGIKVDWLITHRVSLSEIHKGIEHTKNKVGFKTIITF